MKFFVKVGILVLSFLPISFFSFGQDTDFESVLSDDIATYKFNLFEADRYFLEENFDLAENYYLLCLNMQPDNAFLMYRLASIYFNKNNLALAEDYIDRCISLNNSNEWYLFLAGNIYSVSKKFDKAESVFKSLIDKNPSEFDFYICLSDVYIQNNRLKDAIKIYDLVEKKFGIDESLLIQKKNIYLKLNNKKKAESELIKLVSTFPEEMQFKRILADFYLQIGNSDKAISVFNNVISENPSDGYSHLGLASCYQYLEKFDKVYSELEAGFSASNVSIDVKVGILVELLSNLNNNQEEFDKLFHLSEVLLKNYPDSPDVNAIYADLQLNKGNIDIARLALVKVIESRKDKYPIWEHLLLIDNQLGDWVSLFKHSSEAIEYFPNIPLFYFLNGFSGFQLAKYDKAKKSLEFGFNILPKNDKLAPDFLTFLGEVNYNLGDKDKAYEYFDKLIALDPNNTMVLNNYSYYLSLDKRNLDRAKTMSYATIMSEPDNPTFLDTYAWILFELKSYSESLIYIKKAVELDRTRSDVIIEHYGDILYFNGDVEGALEQWKRVKTLGKGGEKIDEKIASKKYVE
jgi:tetratricopeptide (TPR) repeat protein